ncbi:hypothetical protein GGR50DRAFT_691111 [Xylaria sp. CBS 124048]|nr:hypothetical protein GGR50DRAFT_691111 [Xylaria sp. CBS 124048]
MARWDPNGSEPRPVCADATTAFDAGTDKCAQCEEDGRTCSPLTWDLLCPGENLAWLIARFDPTNVFNLHPEELAGLESAQIAVAKLLEKRSDRKERKLYKKRRVIALERIADAAEEIAANIPALSETNAVAHREALSEVQKAMSEKESNQEKQKQNKSTNEVEEESTVGKTTGQQKDWRNATPEEAREMWISCRSVRHEDLFRGHESPRN